MGFRHELQRLKDADPGRRFENGYERTKADNRVLRIALIVLGFGLMVAAAVTFWLPGPNFILVLAGLALVGGQSRTVAKFLDRGEVGARRWHRERWVPYPHKARAKAIGALVVVTALGLLGWLAVEQGWVPGWVPLVD